MSEECSIKSCERRSHILCHGCKLNFCREHMFEHSASIHLQLNPLIDETNQLNDQLKGINLQDLLQFSYQQLEQWRMESHRTIDVYFAEKCRDLESYINKKLKYCLDELKNIQTKLISYSREQETTHERINFLSYQLQNLQRDVTKVMQNDYQMNLNSVTIDKNLINFDRPFDLANFPPVYRVIGRDDASYTSLATDNQYLLLHHQGTLVLVNEDLTTYKQVPWTNGHIYDMCYSSLIKRFIIINENEVFLLNEINMSINKVRTIPWQQWFSCTCSNTYLYLSTKVYNSALVQYSLSPSITFVKRWASLDICTEDEAIDGIVHNDNTLALMISNDKKRIARLELRSIITFGRIWSIRLDVIYDDKQAFRFCSINHDEWIVADHKSSSLLLISRDGLMKTVTKYQTGPCCVTEFGHNTLAVSTKTVVNLHKL
jgi:hypothetical protein